MANSALNLARPFLDEIYKRSTEFERQGFVTQDIADRLAATGLYRMCNVSEQGGLGCTPRDYAEVVECIAEKDASMAWVLFIGITSALAFNNLSEPERTNILSDSRKITCGVFAPMGRAYAETRNGEEGFCLNGQWQWGSGIRNSSYLTAGVMITDKEGSLLTDKEGRPEQRVFILDQKSVDILDSWHVSGLKGTGSTEFKASNLFVPKTRVFDPFQSEQSDKPIYNFPQFGFLGIGIASVALGIGAASLAHLTDLASVKAPQGSQRTIAQRPTVQVQIAEATAQLRSARLLVYDAINKAWDEAVAKGLSSIERRADLRLALTYAVRNSAEVVNKLYTLAGGSSVFLSNPLQRHFRDVHVATQHMMVGESTMELVGKLILKQEANTSQL